METVIKWKTENPPDKFNRYLVTYVDGTIDTCIWTHHTDYLYGANSEKYHWYNPRGKIIAYAELPKPYRGDTNENEK